MLVNIGCGDDGQSFSSGALMLFSLLSFVICIKTHIRIVVRVLRDCHSLQSDEFFFAVVPSFS